MKTNLGALPMDLHQPYRLAFEKNPQPMWVVDVETHAFLAVNEAAILAYGYSREEFLCMTLHQVCLPAKQEDPRRTLSGNDRPVEVSQHRKKDGSVIQVEISSSPLPFESRPARLMLVSDITARKRMETSLVESEARLRAYLESASEGILVVDREGRIDFVNAKTEALFGYTRAELMGIPMEILVPERYRKAHTSDRARFAADPRTRPMGTRMSLAGRRKDGSEFPVEVGLSAVSIGGGLMQIGFINDISARRQVEDALRQSEQRIRNLLETTSDCVWETDEHGVFTYISPQVFKILGYEPEELIGKTPFDLMPEDEARRAREFHAAMSAEAKPFQHFETVVLHKFGHALLLEANAVPWFDQHGVFRGYRGIDRDITERHRAGEALRRSEASLARAQRIAHLGNWEQDPLTGELQWSDEVYRIFNVSPEEPPTREIFYERVHPEDRPAVRAAVDAAMDAGRPYNLDHRIVLPDGTERHVREHAEVVRLEDGGVRLVGTVQDITEYKRLEEQLRQSQRMEAVGRLAGGVAHDFNNLLTIISGYSELLTTDIPPGTPQRKDLDEVIRAAERAASLTRQLLAFSRRQILQMKTLNLNTVVADLDKMLRRLIGEDIRLTLELDPHLGATKADPTQIEQVIMNLAVNARDAMPRGGRLLLETGNVNLDETYSLDHPEVQPGSYVMLAVSDDGIGMSAKTISHIFEPFFTTKPRDKGTGLGLSTVYGIVKQSGGSIFVYSEPGRGSTFKIYLPRVDTHAVGKVPAAVPLASRGAETVLVVEDETGVRALIRAILESSGYTVLDAQRGADAVEILRSRTSPVNLMVTDVVMPEMSGCELAEHARTMAPEMKVLFISGYTDEAIVHHGVLEAGIPFLQKPFTHQALTRKIRELLDNGK
ncbi:MAG TPA: PAS domain S-box protein [Bryobacteraceae bacterium]|nr:PAS domain S-box protein [Bryobacteraceae bacterium]